MIHPTIRFVFDPEFDANLAWKFYSYPVCGGTNFWEKGAIPYHEKLKTLGHVRNKKSFLKGYTLSLYQENSKPIHLRGQEIKRLYKTKKSTFFKETDRLFHKRGLNARYTAYFSIFDFCPRILNKNCFFVFLSNNDEDTLFTIFHELLHFYFYNYCRSEYPKFFKHMDTEQGAFWEIAELFNSVVMQTPEFTKLYGIKPLLGYPELHSAFKKAKHIWNGDIDYWISEFALPYINKQTFNVAE
jgi:hypothetical protein